MVISLGNRAKMSTSTTGTGTITLGSAVSGYQSFANAGITNGQTVRYAIEDGTAFEIGSGTYTSSGTTLTRSVTESSNSDSAITLSGNAEVFVTATVADLYINDGASTLTTTGVITGGTVEATSDTAAGDNAAMGYTSAEGLILTGQGSTNDITIKNDADADVLEIPTGTTNVTVAGNLGVGGTVTATGTSVFATLDISGNVDVDGTLESDAITLNGTAVTATATLSTGISNNNVPKFTSGVADNDFLRVDGTAIEGRSASEVLSDIGAAPAAGSSNIVTTGALNSGSITSGFGTIDTGSSNITTTGVGSFGSLDISGAIDVDGTTNLDAVDIDGAVNVAADLTIASTNKILFNDASQFIQGSSATVLTIAATDEIDLTATTIDINGAVALNGAITGATNITLSGELDAATGDFSGDVDVDGTLEADAITIGGTALATVIAGTTVTNATNSAHVLVTDNESTNEENLIAFVEGATSSTGNVGLEMDGNFSYNPSTGTVSATVFKGNIDAVDGDFDGTLEADAITIGGTAVGSIFSPIAGGTGIVTTGALDAGSITSGFGAINNGSSAITTTGVGTFGSLDISGNIDVDGTTNLDAVDIDGAVQLDATLTVGVDDTGYDVKFFGDAASAFMQWDASADDLILGGAAGLIVPDGKLTLGSTAVTSTGAELNILDGVTSNATEINQLDALTRGSILYGNASGATARLAKGAANTVLTSDGTDISYAALSVAVGLDGSGNPTLASTVTAAEMRTLISAAEAQIGTPTPNWANPDETYTSSGTWSKGSLADDALVWMYAVGGGSSGGSGGSSNPSSPQRGGLGGLSFFVLGTAAQLNGGQFVIGAGGAAASDAEGNAGGATTLTVSGVTYTTGDPDNSGNANTGQTVLSGIPDGAATSTTAFFFTYAYPAFFTTTVDETKFKGSPSSGTGFNRGAVYDDGTTSDQPSNNISEYGGDAGASPNQNSAGNAGAVPGGGGSAAFGAASGAGGAGNLRVYHL